MRAVIAALAVAAFAATAGAEIMLEGAGWQEGRVERPARPARFSDSQSAAYAGKKPPILRGKAVLKNRGPKPAEGLLVRYSVTARLVAPGAAAGAAGEWAVPFLVDERRVAKIPPNKVLEVPLQLSPVLDIYLKRMTREGFRVDRLKLSAMLEPQKAQAVVVKDAELEISP